MGEKLARRGTGPTKLAISGTDCRPRARTRRFGNSSNDRYAWRV